MSGASDKHTECVEQITSALVEAWRSGFDVREVLELAVWNAALDIPQDGVPATAPGRLRVARLMQTRERLRLFDDAA